MHITHPFYLFIHFIQFHLHSLTLYLLSSTFTHLGICFISPPNSFERTNARMRFWWNIYHGRWPTIRIRIRIRWPTIRIRIRIRWPTIRMRFWWNIYNGRWPTIAIGHGRPTAKVALYSPASSDFPRSQSFTQFYPPFLSNIACQLILFSRPWLTLRYM